MEMEKDWRSFEPEDSDLDDMLGKLRVSELHSTNVLTRIRKSLYMSTAVSIPLTAAFVIFIVFAKLPEAQLLLLVAAGGCVWSILETVKLYRKIDIHVLPGNALLQQLKLNRQHIVSYINIQEKGSVFIYPFSRSGGFLYGGSLNLHRSAAMVLSERPMLIALILSIVILTPLCYVAVHYAFKYLFGKHLKKLSDIISQLEENQ